jgi:hypothetical protein
MGEGHAGKEAPFEDRRMWRLLLARLHPDAGGAHELFLFACALKDEVCRERLFTSEPAARDDTGVDHSFSTWRGTMNSWASHNRDALKSSRSQRGSARDRRAWDAI